MTEAVDVLAVRWLHEGWSRYGVTRLRLANGNEVERELEDHGRAVGVLPYDPERRVALLVRQPRVGPASVGETEFLHECPAGRLAAEDPEEEVRREALEEVGVHLGVLEFVVDAWSLASVSTDRIKLYLASFSAVDRVAEGGGVPEENEAVQVVEMPLAELDARAADGRLTDMKTMLLALALRVRRPDLFA